MSKKIIFTFGRFNPPTIGHQKLIEKVVSYAHSHGADHAIFASKSHDSDRNPLPYTQKISFLGKLFPKVNFVSDHGNQIFAVIKSFIDKGYDDITMVVGSDRVDDFRTTVGKYVKKATDPDFDPKKHFAIKWTVISAGERDPDATGIEGASGTKMRQFAAQNDFGSYAKNTPTKNVMLIKTIFNTVRQNLNQKVIKESYVKNSDLQPAVMLGKKIYISHGDDWHIDVIKKLPPDKQAELDRQPNPDRNIGYYHEPTKKFIPSTQISLDSNRARLEPDDETVVSDGIKPAWNMGWNYPSNAVKNAIKYRNNPERSNQDDQWGVSDDKSSNTKTLDKNGGRWKRPEVTHRPGSRKPIKEETLTEGVNDRSIFKAVFLAGGPGSGKDYIMKQTLLGLGLTELNSDIAFEFLMRKEGFDMTMPDSEMDRRNLIRGRAKNITLDKTRLAIMGRLGLIINGTADSVEDITAYKSRLEEMGYETMMVFVNTSDEISKHRNIMRGQMGGRTVPESIRSSKWQASQSNLEAFKKLFGWGRFIVVDNSMDTTKAAPTVQQSIKANLDKVYKHVSKFVAEPVKSKNAQKWMASQKKPNIKEHAGFEGTDKLVLNRVAVTPGQENADAPTSKQNNKYLVKPTLKMIRQRIK